MSGWNIGTGTKSRISLKRKIPLKGGRKCGITDHIAIKAKVAAKPIVDERDLKQELLLSLAPIPDDCRSSPYRKNEGRDVHYRVRANPIQLSGPPTCVIPSYVYLFLALP